MLSTGGPAVLVIVAPRSLPGGQIEGYPGPVIHASEATQRLVRSGGDFSRPLSVSGVAITMRGDRARVSWEDGIGGSAGAGYTVFLRKIRDRWVVAGVRCEYVT